MMFKPISSDATTVVMSPLIPLRGRHVRDTQKPREELIRKTAVFHRIPLDRPGAQKEMISHGPFVELAVIHSWLTFG
jgi:hypothetical protein